MRSHFKRYQKPRQVNAEQIWEIDFFWAKNISCSEDELREATYKAMHPEEKKKDQFKKAS